MPSQAFPTVNEVESSWADVGITFDVTEGQSLSITDVESIKWDRSLEVGVKRGTSGGRIMARTTGQGDQSASVVFYRSGVKKLIRALIERAPQRGNQRLIGQVTFNVQIQHTPIGSDEIFETILKGCRYLGDADDMAEGPDADTVEVTLNPIEIANLVDGLEVVLV